ncbi:MAG: alpha-galactosidase [Kiritimatiellia bacterium]
MKTLTKLASLAGVLVWAQAAAAARVEVLDCPKCPRSARYADDGTSATVNRARLVGATQAETEAAITAAVKRAEAVLAANVVPDEKVRPLMGWSSWNCFALEIDEEKILSQAAAMATNGLKRAGYLYINTDDGFFDGHDENGRLKWNLRRFPRGMKPVADGIHAWGLKAGIYSDAGADMCGGSKGSGLYGHDADDCRLHFNELGFDFIKVDYCGGSKLGLNEKDRYTEISRAIRATGRDVKFNICRWAYPGTWVSDVADSWRVTGDIRADWRSVRYIFLLGMPLSAYASRGHYNDLDMLEFGHAPGWKPSFDGDLGLTSDEEISHFGLWCILSSPLVLGCDLRTMPQAALALATNPYLIAMNANDLGLQAYPVRYAGDVVTLVKDAGERYGRSRYVAVVNLGDAAATVKLALDDVDLAGRTFAVDLVEKAEVGAFEKEMQFSLKPHEGRFYRLFAERRLPRRVYRADASWLRRYHKLNWSDDAPLYTQMQPGPGEVWDAVIAVTGLGGRDDNDLLWRDVRLDETREYTLTFTVVSPAPQRFSVSVDGAPATELSVPARRWVQDVSCRLNLSAGSHEVRVFNAKEAVPAIVQMTVR